MIILSNKNITYINVFSSDAVRYSFGPVIQKQLSQLVMEWNHHRIRKTLTAEAPGGIPEVLYHLPPQGMIYLHFSVS